MKQLHFIAGLPRSGSTLLCNLLAQNPNFFVRGTSPLIDILVSTRNAWSSTAEVLANPIDQRNGTLNHIYAGIVNGYYSDADDLIVFDKSRGWLPYIELIEGALDVEARILVPVRDVRDVLASFEKMYRKASPTFRFPGEAENYAQFQTIEGRCNFWLRHDEPIGVAVNRLNDAMARGHGGKMLFVPYHVLTTSPKKMLARIHDFIDTPAFDYNVDNVEQLIFENDGAYNLGIEFHNIRPKIEYPGPIWPEILGEIGMRFTSGGFDKFS